MFYAPEARTRASGSRWPRDVEPGPKAQGLGPGPGPELWVLSRALGPGPSPNPGPGLRAYARTQGPVRAPRGMGAKIFISPSSKTNPLRNEPLLLTVTKYLK